MCSSSILTEVSLISSRRKLLRISVEGVLRMCRTGSVNGIAMLVRATLGLSTVCSHTELAKEGKRIDATIIIVSRTSIVEGKDQDSVDNVFLMFLGIRRSIPRSICEIGFSQNIFSIEIFCGYFDDSFKDTILRIDI